ncbi:MAG: endonuclease III domain-containing protein [bacterium]
MRDSRNLSLDTLLYKVFTVLYDTFGPQHWWPGETPLEIIIGAILTQNTNWKNVEKAIYNLKTKGMLSVEGILENRDVVKELIKPAGYYNIKVARLINMMERIKEYNSLDEFLKLPMENLRGELLRIKGIGLETADSILLYAGNYPIFVVDSYTRRIFSRLGIIKGDEPYEKIQHIVMENLPRKVSIYNEFHALLVELGKRNCKKMPIHNGCPLYSLCKEVSDER